MSQPELEDPEVGRPPGGQVDDHARDHAKMPNKPSQGEYNFGDSSGSLFTIYYKAAEEEDNKMVKRWQEDAKGILIFTGLFSASVAALLAVTVQDLRPNSQDTSAFYLGNIYQVLADPNVTRTSTPPVANPPSFSPSRYAVWVNSLWFLSLVMSLSCALWATSLQRWARQFLDRTQPARCSPEKRARMRAFFASGVDKMHMPWAVEGLPTLLHLSLFLFFGGLAILLFNVNREVFLYVVWWVGLFFLVYGMITVLPLIREDSPYNSPLSTPAWYLHTTMTYVTVKILHFIIHFCLHIYYLVSFCSIRIYNFRTSAVTDMYHSEKYYRRRVLGGIEMAVEKAASKRSSMIDLEILDWTISALGDDDSLKSFFEAIPGFFNSTLVKHLGRGFPAELDQKFEAAFNGFLLRTCTSNSVDESEKIRRLDILVNAINQTTRNTLHDTLHYFLYTLRNDEVPKTVEMGHILAHWLQLRKEEKCDTCTVVWEDIVAGILVSVRERNDSWVTLAARTFGLPERDLLDNIALGDDSVLLAILFHVARQSHRSEDSKENASIVLSKLDICNTHPRMQHDFCTFWNEIRQEARSLGRHSYHINVRILCEIRHLYLALHQDTDAAPTAFSASTPFSANYEILYEPSSYPFCTLASHRPDSTSHISAPLPAPPAHSPYALFPSPTDRSNTASRQAEQVNIVIQPTPHSHSPDMTPPTHPTHSSSRPSGASPAAAVAATQDITSTAMLSHPLEGSDYQDSDIVAPSAEPGTIASTHLPTPALALIPTSLPNIPSGSYDEGVPSVSNPSHFDIPFIGSSFPTYRPTRSATLPRPRPRGLVNTSNICFANAVLQLLANSPPFRNLFGELGDLKEQRRAGVPDAGGGAMPLVDATVRFFKEFLVEESQQARGGTSGVDDENNDDNVVDSFEPTYMYDTMKEKRQLKPLFDGQQQDAEEFLSLYLDTLDEEFHTLLTSISGGQSTSASLDVEEREVSQTGQTEVGRQGIVANFVESPIARIFWGRFCSHVRTVDKPDVITTEHWRSLHLDIQYDSIRSVQDTLTRFSQQQSVRFSASGLGNASRQVLIEALPPVLVLHLNRVQYDAAAGGITKIGKSIQLAPELEIPLDIMVPTAQRPSEPPRYKLYGVLYHHGEYADIGHYTVDVLRPNGDGNTGEDWLHIDDEAVSPMRHEDVFWEDGTERAADEGCAYLLFYCRISPIATS